MTMPFTLLEKLRLSPEFHRTPDEGTSLMQSVSFVLDGTHMQRPPAICPVITLVAIWANNRIAFLDRHTLGAFIFPITQTRVDTQTIAKRTEHLADYVMRVHLPELLAQGEMHWPSTALANLPPLRPGDSPRAHLDALQRISGWVKVETSGPNTYDVSMRAVQQLRDMLTTYRATKEFPSLTAWQSMLYHSPWNAQPARLLNELLAIDPPAKESPTQKQVLAKLKQLATRQEKRLLGALWQEPPYPFGGSRPRESAEAPTS